MKFIRFILALLIAGGIGYGLYTMTEGQRAADGTAMEDTSSGAQMAERGTIDDPEGPDSEATEEAEAPEPAEGETPEAEAQEANEAENAAPEDTTLADRATESIESLAADTQSEASASDNADATQSTEPSSEDTITAQETADAEEAPTTASASTDAAAPQASTASLPSAEIQTGSVDALKVITGGMSYAEARQTMIDASWRPRALDRDARSGDLYDAEKMLLDAGYDELESCSGSDRAICRFEFIDGKQQIAAVITAGSDGNPSVIDAFLMDISAE